MMSWTMTKHEYEQISEALARLKESFDRYTDSLKRENEILLGVVGYPNSFISEQEQETYESNH